MTRTALYAVALSTLIACVAPPARAEGPDSPPAAAGWLEGVAPERLVRPLLAEIPIPLMRQWGDKANCGPTAAAMVIAAYQQLADVARLEELRDRIGEWSWTEFPMRRLSLPGYDAGLSTPGMLLAMLNGFVGGDVTFAEVPDHPFIPRSVWGLLAMKAAVAEGRPVLTLVQASTLWGTREPGLHWVVVRAVGDGQVVYNDPADRSRVAVPADKFWEAWRLLPLFRDLSLTRSFTALVASHPVPAWTTAQAATDR